MVFAARKRGRHGLRREALHDDMARHALCELLLAEEDRGHGLLAQRLRILLAGGADHDLDVRVERASSGYQLKHADGTRYPSVNGSRERACNLP